MEDTKVSRENHVNLCYPVLKIISEHKNEIVGYSEIEKGTELINREMGLEILISKGILKQGHSKTKEGVEIAFSIIPKYKERVEKSVKTTKPFIESLDNLYGKPEKKKIYTRTFKKTRFKK